VSVLGSSYIRHPQDALLIMRSIGLAPVATTTATAALQLDGMTNYWSVGESAQSGKVDIVVQVESITGITPSVIFQIQLASVSDPDFNSPATVASSEAFSSPGFDVVSIANQDIVQANAVGGWVRVNAVITGNSGLVNNVQVNLGVAFNAFLST
jgi:hypothetical protein